MTLRFKTLLSVAAIVCALGGTALGQRIPKDTRREPDSKPGSARPGRRPKPHQLAPALSKTPAAVESNNFFNLGNGFRDQKRWKAAEAAYKEAINAWPSNADALLELGFLYLDRNKIDEAEQTYGKLRSVNAPYAANLLAEINRYKATLAH